MERSGDVVGQSILYSDLGFVARETGAFEDALGYYEQSVTLMRQTQNQGGLADTWRMIARTYVMQEKFDDALACCRTSLGIAERLGDELRIGGVWFLMSHCYEQLQDLHTAAELLERVVAIDEKYALPKLQENRTRLRAIERQLRDRPMGSFPPEGAHPTERPS